MLDAREKDRRKLLYSAKGRARVRGLPFNLRATDIEIPERCPVLDIPLKVNRGKRGGDSPSVDRIRPEHGYVRGNIAVISMRANAIKTNATADELLAVALYAHRHTFKSQAIASGRVFLRGKIWWCAFHRGGEEYRKSSRSKSKADAQALLKKFTGADHGDCVVCGAKDFLVTICLCTDCIERL